MKYSKNYEPLGLPKEFKFGIELEAFNVRTKGKNSLYTGESAEFIRSRNWHMATKREEPLVGEGGAELVSPILQDRREDWECIAEICEQIKKYPGNKGSEVVANEKCGFHVHFDANCLAQDPKRMKNFKKLYAESEELLYKMCNSEGDPIRKNALNKDFKGIHLISSIWRNGMASPIGAKILRQLESRNIESII